MSGEAWRRLYPVPIPPSIPQSTTPPFNRPLYMYITARFHIYGVREYRRANASARPPWKMDFNLIPAVQKHTACPRTVLSTCLPPRVNSIMSSLEHFAGGSRRSPHPFVRRKETRGDWLASRRSSLRQKWLWGTEN